GLCVSIQRKAWAPSFFWPGRDPRAPLATRGGHPAPRGAPAARRPRAARGLPRSLGRGGAVFRKARNSGAPRRRRPHEIGGGPHPISLRDAMRRTRISWSVGLMLVMLATAARLLGPPRAVLAH